MPYMDIKQLLQENVQKAVKKALNTKENIKIEIEHPENEKFGEYSVNIAMQLAKKLKVSPQKIAQQLCFELQSYEMSFKESSLTYPVFKKIEVVNPGFINFHLSNEYLKFNLEEISKHKDKYGSLTIGKNKPIVIEYSQPNPNKPMHIGHARNNFLGSSLAEIFKFAGYDVTKVNYMNDWGTHICKSMLMYAKYGENKEPDKKSDHFVGDFYIRYEKEVEENPDLEKELLALFGKLEEGDPATVVLWKKITGWAYEGWKSTYDQENVTFDVWMYQSNYTKAGKEIVKLAIDKGVAEKDETGAVIARLEKYNIPDKVMLRKDGSSVYVTQDTQLAKDSYDKFHFEKRLYVVDNRQSDYFKQLFKILEILGFEWFDKLFHVSYGVVSLPEGNMSSRKGIVANADEVFEQVVEAEKQEIQGSLKKVVDNRSVVEKVALGALRYGMLKVDPKQDITFNVAQVTSFDGNTGPYLMYTYARARSIMEKAGIEDGKQTFDLQRVAELSLADKERAVLVLLTNFPEVIADSVEKLTPHFLTNYVYDLCQKYNSFYGEYPVLTAEDPLVKELRLMITACTAQVIKNALHLLGIEVVEKM